LKTRKKASGPSVEVGNHEFLLPGDRQERESVIIYEHSKEIMTSHSLGSLNLTLVRSTLKWTNEINTWVLFFAIAFQNYLKKKNYFIFFFTLN
jgi:hypothetical protein